MLHVRRRALIALLGAGLALSSIVGSVAAAAPTNPGTYTGTICYDAANVQVVIHQVWSGMEVDEVQAGIGGRKGGLGIDNTEVGVPATSGDETDSFPADPHAKVVGGSVLDLGQTLGSVTVNKIKGSWAKSLP
ncbi:MAG TPA: hypothetical protein VF484_02350, partial [Candidatus Limnocylindrales bacterium]